MKLKRTKLAALAMSALMAVSAFSPYVYAEGESEATTEAEVVGEAAEETVDETANEAAAASLEEEEATVEDTGSASTVSDDTPGTIADEINCKYDVAYVNLASDYSSIVIKVAVYDATSESLITTVTVNGSASSLKGTDSDTNYSWEFTSYKEPSCTTDGSIVMKFTGHGKSFTYNVATNVATNVDTVGVTVTATATTTLLTAGHRTKVGSEPLYYEDAAGNKYTSFTCALAGKVYAVYEETCSVCGTLLGSKTSSTPSYGAPHQLSSSYTIVAQAGDNVKYDSSSVVATETNATIVDSQGLQQTEDDNLTLATVSGTFYKISGDTAQLSNPQKGGTFYLRYTCTACGEAVYVKETLSATQAAYGRITSISGIRYFYIYDEGTATLNRYSASELKSNDDLKFSTTLTGDTGYIAIPDDNLIELTNCSVAGTYTITYYDANGNPMGRLERETVAAHHMTMQVAVFESQAALNHCTVTYDSNGNIKSVKSDVCYPLYTYYIVEECYAVGCTATVCEDTYEVGGALWCWKADTINTITESGTTTIKDNLNLTGVVLNGASGKGSYALACNYREISRGSAQTADQGSHAWLQSVFEYLETAYATRKSNEQTITTDNILTWINTGLADTSSVATKYATYGDYVKITSDTSGCEKTGVVTVTFYCTNENAGAYAVYSKTYSVAARGHKSAGVVATITKEATCENEGEYTVTNLCEYCGIELEPTETETIPRLPHTNEISASPTDYYA